ncbi:hypothetical protein AX14_010872 [Amanita brunnescens Koide BX004]|nr:hypothetical protein AX14_010872 [Amanita brunnescens Koide BX004]
MRLSIIAIFFLFLCTILASPVTKNCSTKGASGSLHRRGCFGDQNKNRLFITLQYRSDGGFHWTLLLAPKVESEEKEDRDSHFFHAVNNIAGGMQLTPGEKPPWRYDERRGNVMNSPTMTARILVAKLSSAVPFEEQVEQINRILRTVPIVQNDAGWTCRVWAEHGLAALRATGGDFSSIPDVTAGGALETRIIRFGEEGRTTILTRGRKFEHLNELPQLDLRVRQ